MTKTKVSGRNNREGLNARQINEIVRTGNGRFVELVRNLNDRVLDSGLRLSTIRLAKAALPQYFEDVDLEKRLSHEDNLAIELFRGVVAYDRVVEREEDSKYNPFVCVAEKNRTRAGEVREIRTYNLPTPRTMTRYVEVRPFEVDSPIGQGTMTSYQAEIPEKYGREIFKKGMRQALFGTRVRVGVREYEIERSDDGLRTHKTDSHVYFAGNRKLSEEDITVLADIAERNKRTKGNKGTEFEVTQASGVHSGVKFFLYTTVYPIVMVSTVPLEPKNVFTKMDQYHSRKIEFAESAAGEKLYAGQTAIRSR